MTPRTCVVALACVLALAGELVGAQSPRPDFSGTWTLDKQASAFGDIPGGTPTARTDVIQQQRQFLRQTLYLNNGGHLDTTIYRYTTDGAESVNNVAGSKIKSKVWWDGTLLHLESRTKVLILSASLSETWSLSPDGRTLTMTRDMDSPLAKGKQTLVFVKQADAVAEPVVAGGEE